MGSRVAPAIESRYINDEDVVYLEQQLDAIEPDKLKVDPVMLTAMGLRLRSAAGEAEQELAARIFSLVWLRWPKYRSALAESRIAGELRGRLADQLEARQLSMARVN